MRPQEIVFSRYYFQGQLLDLLTESEARDPVDFSRYSLETHRKIVVFKTAYYSFYLPVACSMHLGGVTEEQAFARAKKICVKMGEYFQVFLFKKNS